MRDIVGEQWYNVAVAACNLYHGLLLAGRTASPPESLGATMRKLREAAFQEAAEATAAAAASRALQEGRKRREQEAQQQQAQQQQQLAEAAAEPAGASPLVPAFGQVQRSWFSMLVHGGGGGGDPEEAGLDQLKRRLKRMLGSPRSPGGGPRAQAKRLQLEEPAEGERQDAAAATVSIAAMSLR